MHLCVSSIIPVETKMADRRRRRRRASQDSDDDDDESASGSESRESGSQTSKSRSAREPEPVETVSVRVEAKEEAQSECESEDGVGEAVLSDYDSADPEENASHSEGAEEEEDADGYSDEEAQVAAAAAGHSTLVTTSEPALGEDEGDGEERSKEEESEEKGKSAGERQSGDGQESTVDPETKAGGQSGQQLDDDEDRKNPAYIPRKGLFFEHDVRGHTQEEERPKGRNRKLWKDEGRWEHDKFREEEQAPKSREELIASYGYDIRNGERGFMHRRQRSSVSPNREQRWREGGERPVRSWQSNRGGRGGGPARGAPPHHASPTSVSLAPGQRSNASRGRPSHFPSQQPQYGVSESHAPQLHAREKAGPKALPESLADRGGRSGRVKVTDDPPVSQDSRLPSSGTPSVQHAPYRSTSSKTLPLEQRAGPPSAQPSHASPTPREASPPAERPVERKSYSLARRSRSRPTELGSKQSSVETPAAAGAKSPTGAGGAVAEIDQDVARLSLVSGQTWNRSPASYVHAEIRGLSGGLHVPGGPSAFSALDELSGSSNRAKRYSSQRQRGVAEAPPLHMGVMENHYYEPITYQGPIYTHSDGPAPMAPQGMLVQPEMHIPHPGLHPHQSGGPITNPALYGGPPVPLSPGQPQQLLPPPPPFYPPPGVMTFPYPTMYPSPQGQTQVTYGGVTYYDTMQQQAQPKPSPPRRTSQPVTVKPPPPEVPFASE
ncbi:protein CASC3 [Syngnathus typhle]